MLLIHSARAVSLRKGVYTPPGDKLLIVNVLVLFVTVCICFLYANIIKKSATCADFGIFLQVCKEKR